MSRRYIPCHYTYSKGSSCPKVKKNTDKPTVQNNYNPGSRAELLSNMFKQAKISSNSNIKISNVKQYTGTMHNSIIVPFNSKNSQFSIK